MPPILLDYDYGILDGHHRWEAAKKLKIKKIPVIFYKYPDEEDLFEGVHFNLDTESDTINNLIKIETNFELKEFLDKYGFKSNFTLNNEIENIRDIKIIGAGDIGLVYEYKGYIFKLTADKQSYLMSRKLIGKKFKHLVDILDVEVIHNKTMSLYLIKMNKCQPMPYQIRLFFENMVVSYLIQPEYEEHLNKALTTLYNSATVSNEVMRYLKKINIVKQLKEIKEELKIAGLDKYTLDLNLGNIMMKNNQICLIDFLQPKRK